jgi:hypothetical protein
MIKVMVRLRRGVVLRGRTDRDRLVLIRKQHALIG